MKFTKKSAILLPEKENDGRSFSYKNKSASKPINGLLRFGGSFMEVIHRFNSDARQHYLLEKHYAFKLKPRLLYAGYLDKHGGWREEPHSHPFLEIVFITDGSGTVMIDNKE